MLYVTGLTANALFKERVAAARYVSNAGAQGCWEELLTAAAETAAVTPECRTKHEDHSNWQVAYCLVAVVIYLVVRLPL